MSKYEEARKVADQQAAFLKLLTTERQAVHLLTDVFISDPSGLIFFSFEGTFLHGNPAWKKITGYNDSDLYGIQIAELLHPDDVAPTLEAMGYAARGVNPAYFINRYKVKDGSYKWLLWHPQAAANDPKYGAAFCSEVREVPAGLVAGFISPERVIEEIKIV